MTARMESCWQLMQDRCWLGNVPAALLSTDTGKKGTNLCHPPSSSTLLLPRWPRKAGDSLKKSGMTLFLKRKGWRTMARQRPGATGTPYTAAGSWGGGGGGGLVCERACVWVCVGGGRAGRSSRV